MRGALVAGVLVLAAVFAAPAAAAGLGPWDGSNPFTCSLQNGASPQDPNADPLCVEYDHSGSSLSDAESQLTALVSDGPNQMAASVNKCALYRVDHFTGPLYELDSALFFNKAAGTGGSALTAVTINGVPAPPSAVPGLPTDLGSIVNVPVVQACTSQSQGGGEGGGTTGGGGGLLGSVSGPSPGAIPYVGASCKKLSGNANRGLGRARLGLKRATVGKRLGKPTRRAHGFYHYCLRKGGDLAIHFGRHSKADVVLASGRPFHAGKVKIGSRLQRVRSSLRHEQVLGHRKRDWVLGVTHRHWLLLVGLSKNRVVYIAAVSRALSIPKLGKILTNAGR
jgi:hypothetical protein